MSLIDFGHLREDEHGDTIIQFVLVLPIFIILVLGSYEIWKLVHFKQTLEAATIQATRYLSIEGPFLLDEYPYGWQQRAWAIVYQELENEPLLQEELDPNRLTVEVGTRRGLGWPACPDEYARRPQEAVDRAERAQFAVRSRLEIRSPVRIPLVGTPDNLKLEETHWHYLECLPNIPEPEATPSGLTCL